MTNKVYKIIYNDNITDKVDKIIIIKIITYDVFKLSLIGL